MVRSTGGGWPVATVGPMSGPLALVGGGEWQVGCDFDAELLAASGTDEVVVLPTAAAYEHPDHAVERATRWFETLDARVRGVHVVDRTGAHDEANAAAVRAARFVYLSDGSPMHLRSVLMQSPLWDALVAAWRATSRRVVAVTNEVGQGLVPADSGSRRFRDEMGRLNAAIAAETEDVRLCVAGRVTTL